MLFCPLLTIHCCHYLLNGINRHVKHAHSQYLQRSTMSSPKVCCPHCTWEGSARVLRIAYSKYTMSALLVCHAFPLSQSLSKNSKEVLGPCLQYTLRKLSSLKFLPGKEASFPYSSHYKNSWWCLKKKLLVVYLALCS